MVLSLSKIKCIESNKAHELILRSARQVLADNMPACTTAIINLKHKVFDLLDEETAISESNNHNIKKHVNSKFEKDVSEAIGFHDGNDDIRDIN